MTPAEIVVVGSYNRDLVLSVARLPAPGETCLALGRTEAHGGKGSNQAVQAARCGASVAMLAAVGADAAGEAALAMWRDAGIEAGHVARLPGAATGTAVILVDAAGENSIVVDPGANADLRPAHVEAAAGLVRAARLVLAQLETPVAATRRAFEIARAAGVTTALNAAPAPEALDPQLLALTDILFVNRVEARALADDDRPERVAAALLPKVRRAVVLTLGAEGAVLLRPGEPPLARPARPAAVVDTTGAGDAFIGAFGARLAASGDYGSALDWGLAAGALACTALGATSSFHDAEAIARQV
ncbi:ribokinase [Phenylobacterium sp. LjRoot225]|uniref:ribokinase n=1 Tax=Phenylobacterium sp. LjRoot225 TaxID=3342285 RepID=UPI003ECFF489